MGKVISRQEDEARTITVTTSDLLLVSDAAKALGIPRMKVYRWRDAGKIIGIVLGGVLYIPVSEVKRLKKKAPEMK